MIGSFKGSFGGSFGGQFGGPFGGQLFDDVSLVDIGEGGTPNPGTKFDVAVSFACRMASEKGM